MEPASAVGRAQNGGRGWEKRRGEGKVGEGGERGEGEEMDDMIRLTGWGQ